MIISCYHNSGVARLESCITWEVIYIWWLTSCFSSARYNYVSGKGITRASLEIQLQFCSAWTQNKFSKFYKILSVLNKIMQKILWLYFFVDASVLSYQLEGLLVIAKFLVILNNTLPGLFELHTNVVSRAPPCLHSRHFCSSWICHCSIMQLLL